MRWVGFMVLLTLLLAGCQTTTYQGRPAPVMDLSSRAVVGHYHATVINKETKQTFESSPSDTPEKARLIALRSCHNQSAAVNVCKVVEESH